MMTGTVKFFNQHKYFGFIAGDDGESYFVHGSRLKSPIVADDLVEFEVEQAERGQMAVNVKRIW